MPHHDARAPGFPADAPLSSLILDFLRWLEPHPRPYAEAIDAWRTSCPRLTIWEDALDQGLVCRTADAQGSVIALTPLGREVLESPTKLGNWPDARGVPEVLD